MKMRQRSFVFPEASLWARAKALFGVFTGNSARLEQKVDQLNAELAFLKTHTGVYLGDGIAMTFLPDERPIFINSNDFGGPMNLLNGGLYEQENLDVLLSFLKSGSIALDIGANLGFFALRFAERTNGHGKVFAFEPHPFLFDLLSRTMFLNGLRDAVTACDFGLSDVERTAALNYPTGHLGGGHVVSTGEQGAVESTLRRLDDVLASGTAVDVVKLDVEEHELAVLQGMERVISESPDIAILIEKLRPSAGYEAEMESLLKKQGFRLFSVHPGARLAPISLEEFLPFSGYVLATRAGENFKLDRSFFSIYPEQLRLSASDLRKSDDGDIVLAAGAGCVLFHGPYWSLERGHWQIQIEGMLTGRATLVIAERHNRPVLELDFNGGTPVRAFFLDHPLMQFSLVLRVRSDWAELKLRRVVLTRITEEALYRRLFADSRGKPELRV